MATQAANGWSVSWVLAALVAAGAAHAQVDPPADARRLPRGRGWWCHPGELPNGQRGQVCVRRRPECVRAPGVTSPAQCARQPRAFCVTYTARDYSTNRPLDGALCVATPRECEAQRERLYGTAGRDALVSACTEIR